eukprot:TRINITY_DN3724_c1_g1_i1.p1 TRINITY_DN3724_c1_g1~~TRINITY_DN3724_c1_g1_i1.p1  ORF type:complete len:100 (-),score=22.85 TRINITY_DN3724_c1_g1_i1:2-301(-)
MGPTVEPTKLESKVNVVQLYRGKEMKKWHLSLLSFDFYQNRKAASSMTETKKENSKRKMGREERKEEYCSMQEPRPLLSHFLSFSSFVILFFFFFVTSI